MVIKEVDKMVKMLPSQKGIVLIAVIVFILILTIVGAAFLKLAGSEGVLAHREYCLGQSLYLAEAGVERSISYLESLSSPPGGTASFDPFSGSQTLSNGTYEVSIDPDDNNPTTAKKVYAIISTGRVGTPQIAKTVQVSAETVTVFSLALFGDDDVSLEGGFTSDGYNSTLGSYASQEPTLDGNVGSNQNIFLEGTPTTVQGNVSAGGSVTISGGGTITGTTEEGANQVDLPSVDTDINYHSSNNDNSDIGLTDNGVNPINESGALVLDGGDNLNLDAGNYYFTGIEISGNSTLTIVGEVNLYVSGNCGMSGSALVNEAEDPTDFTLYSNGSSIDLSGGGTFYGAIYAPSANINISGGGDYYGALVGNQITAVGGSSFHYDKAFQDEEALLLGYKIVSWEELPAIWE